jgi:hypothetical protein
MRSATNLTAKGGKPRAVNRASRTSFTVNLLDQNLQDLRAKATAGDFQSQLRLEAIYKLADPCLDFYQSDVQRILGKGYPPSVEKGLRLFRMMSQLRKLCEPIGNTVGIACRVRLINFEELTLNKLFALKGHSTCLVPVAALRFRKGSKFNGLELLSTEEKKLYQRLTPYFSRRKRPTLKSLALYLLGEEDQIFSERNASNYLRAARDFRLMHEHEVGSSLYYIDSVESFNLNAKTGREMFVDLVQRAHRDIELPVISIGQHLSGLYVRAARPLVESLLRVSAAF